eukprot:gene198-biopygen8928
MFADIWDLFGGCIGIPSPAVLGRLEAVSVICPVSDVRDRNRVGIEHGIGSFDSSSRPVANTLLVTRVNQKLETAMVESMESRGLIDLLW